MKGDIDVGSMAMTPEHLAQMEKAPNVKMHYDPSMRLFLITMHNQRPPLDNKNVRKCFSYAFNYDVFINDIMKGKALRNKAPIPNNLFGYPKDIKGYDFNLNKAKEYCDKARAEGANLDREIELHYIHEEDLSKQAAQVFQSDVRKIGVKIKLVADVFDRMAAGASKKESTPDMWVHWVSPYFIDPENWIGQMYNSQFHGTWKASSWYKNPEVDQLLTQAREVIDRSKRAELYEKAARIIVEDAPEIYIYDTVISRGVSARLKNFTFSPVGYGCEVRLMNLVD